MVELRTKKIGEGVESQNGKDSPEVGEFGESKAKDDGIRGR